MQTQLLVEKVRQIEETIKLLNRAMRHVSPESVTALRRTRNELELIYEQIMDSCIRSNTDLEYLFSKNTTCIRECIRPVWSAEPLKLPYPKPYYPPAPPPTPEPPKPTVPEPAPTVSVKGVNLIIYADATGSMTADWRGKLGTAFTKFAQQLKTKSTEAGIPCTVSLIWFGELEGDLYKVKITKGDVSSLAAAFRSVPTLEASDAPESGMLAMRKTLDDLVVPNVQNTLIYVTDAVSKTNEGASANQIKTLFAQKGVDAYAILPKQEVGLSGVFKATQRYGIKYNLQPWVDKTLNP